MKKVISNIAGDVILSFQENGYQSVVDRFQNASYINIVTYNINTYEPKTELIKELRKVGNLTPITLILNIPARRGDYVNRSTGQIDQLAVNNAKKKIKYTLNVLERSKFGNLNVYFNFNNHSKLIMTDTVAYIGSQNFSDASKDNFELGLLVNDPIKVRAINSEIFKEIKDKSILYATSEYAVLMEEISGIMRDSLQNMRQDIFTLVGDEHYYPEIEVLDIDKAFFPEQKWEQFKVLHYEFEEIVGKLINDYPSEFNRDMAESYIEQLTTLIEYFSSELDELADFLNKKEESMMWDEFRQVDTGEDLDLNLEIASSSVREYRHEKFRHIESFGNQLIQSFEEIEQCIGNIEAVIDEIKNAMISQSIYQNINQIKNYK